jgi:hypothetical protein
MSQYLCPSHDTRFVVVRSSFYCFISLSLYRYKDVQSLRSLSYSIAFDHSYYQHYPPSKFPCNYKFSFITFPYFDLHLRTLQSSPDLQHFASASTATIIGSCTSRARNSFRYKQWITLLFEMTLGSAGNAKLSTSSPMQTNSVRFVVMLETIVSAAVSIQATCHNLPAFSLDILNTKMMDVRFRLLGMGCTAV